MISFNPGPSQLTAAVVADLQHLASSGLLSRSHRSAAFIEIACEAFDGLRTALEIPQDYKILYQPSATVAMDTVLRNCVKRKSFHFVHGAFGYRFHDTSAALAIEAEVFESPPDRAVQWRNADVPAGTELIAVTHNETGTGLAWPVGEITELRKAHPEPLLAVDVTSSVGAMRMPWTDADVWFASVQKCLGLPAGMGFLVAGKRAFTRAKEVAADVASWQRLDAMAGRMSTWQTLETPNVLAIALLAKQMARWDLARIEVETLTKARILYDTPVVGWEPYVVDAAWRSATVGNFKVENPQRWVARAAQAEMILGSGYGELKGQCVRVANFPAHTEADVRGLLEVLRKEE